MWFTYKVTSQCKYYLHWCNMIKENIILLTVKNNQSAARNKPAKCDMKEKEKVDNSEVSLEWNDFVQKITFPKKTEFDAK